MIIHLFNHSVKLLLINAVIILYDIKRCNNKYYLLISYNIITAWAIIIIL